MIHGREEWDKLFFATMALASVVAGALGIALTVWRSASSAASLGGREPGSTLISVNVPKIHYQDGEYLVSVRSPGEWHELRTFVQPDNPSLTHAIMEALSG